MWFMGAEENKCVTDMFYTIGLWHASWNKYVFNECLKKLGLSTSLSDVGKEFHSRCAVIAKSRLPNVSVNDSGFVKIAWSADRMARFDLYSTSSSDKYLGACPRATRNSSSSILYGHASIYIVLY